MVSNFHQIQNVRNFLAQGIHHFKPDLFPQFLPFLPLQERGNPIIPVSIVIVKSWDGTYGRISSCCQNLPCAFSPKVTPLTRLLEPDSGLRKRKNHSIWIPIRWANELYPLARFDLQAPGHTAVTRTSGCPPLPRAREARLSIGYMIKSLDIVYWL